MKTVHHTSKEPHKITQTQERRRRIISFLMPVIYLFCIGWVSPLYATQVSAELPLMRAMGMGGNWGGNIDGIKNVPDSYIQYLLKDNVNWINIKVPIFNETITDPTVKIRYRPATDKTYVTMYSFNDNDLINAIMKFKQNGIKVYMSLILHLPSHDPFLNCGTADYGVDPHVMGDPELPNAQNSGSWGYACIDPSLWWWDPNHPKHASNVAAFGASYTKVAVKYAKMAQQLGVEIFSIGEEMDRLFITRPSKRFPNHFRKQLSKMVAAVRNNYKGLVTYGQQSFVYLDHPEWWGLDKKSSSSLFMDLGLDVVSIHGYYSLTNTPVNRVYSVFELAKLWHKIFKDYLVPLKVRNPGIPIMFGDTSAVDAVDILNSSLSHQGDPFIFSDLDGNGIDDGREQQANMFHALLNVNKSYNYLLRGIFFQWCTIDTNPYIWDYNQNHRLIEIHGKPAERVIRAVYRKWKQL